MNGDGLTGRLFEEDVLAECLFQWKAGQAYTPFRQSMRLVRQNQPWDPTDPSTRDGNDLHCQVALALGLEDWSDLQFLTALHSPLDHWHGIDGLFEWQGCVVTIDLTCDHGKEEYKADVIIYPEDSDDQWKLAAHRIAEKFTQQGALAA
ncbi:MAG: hypothetical protein Q7S63_01915 [bacterium]|nr:hypothetical protein [bacterium]